MKSNVKLDARWAKEKVQYSKDKQILFASISRGIKPIINATVKAFVYRPSGDYVEIRKLFIFNSEICLILISLQVLVKMLSLI